MDCGDGTSRANIEFIINLREEFNGLHWAPLVLVVFGTLPSVKAAVDPVTMARLNALLTSTDKVRPLLRMHAGMIAALYPFTGRRLLMKAPKIGPNMRLPASRT